MYTVTTRQQETGRFETLDSTDTLADAIDSAKTSVDGEPYLSVYVFCDQTLAGRTYPYLVAQVTCLPLYNGGTDIQVAYA